MRQPSYDVGLGRECGCFFQLRDSFDRHASLVHKLESVKECDLPVVHTPPIFRTYCSLNGIP